MTARRAGRYPPGGCVLADKTRCTLPPATCCDHGLAIRWPGEDKPAAFVRAMELRASLAEQDARRAGHQAHIPGETP